MTAVLLLFLLSQARAHDLEGRHPVGEAELLIRDGILHAG